MLTEHLAQKMAKLVITDKEFSQCIDQEVKYLREFFVKGKHNGLTPMIHIFFRTNFKEPMQQAIITLAGEGDFFEGENKQKTMLKLGQRFWEDNASMTGHPENKIYPLCVVMSSEAWIKESTAEEESKRGKPISAYDDKKEAIVIQGMTLDRRVTQSTYLLKRAENSMILPIGEVYVKKTSSNIDEIRAYLLEDFFRGFVTSMYQDGEYMKKMGSLEETERET